MDWKAMLDNLIPVVGEEAINLTVGKLDELTGEASEPWKKTVLSLVSDAVEEHGPAGLALAQQALDDLFAGKAPDIDWANPRTASDIVAQMQNAEADRKNATRDFFVKIGDVFGQLFTAFLKGAITSATS
jgi:hypothetical protein